MKIVLREEIILSEKENKAFEEVEKVLIGLQREVKDPTLATEIDRMLHHMYEIYDYITETEDKIQ